MDYRHSIYDDPWGYQNKEELLIFGYSCKLFRDDEKASSLENGEHLIPWMGDSNLMIDRFDVRGTLYDLTEAESKETNSEPLTEAEQKEEEICEQERYLALYHDESQEQAAYEEESKRLQVELSTDGFYYNQVGFSYTNPQYEYNQVSEQDDQQQVIAAEPVSYNPTSDEDVFIPPQEMNIPPDMEVPKTVKQNKIIIKTAKFIVTQGAQMEIVIKTKQAGNAMFSFLAFDNPLNSYYKYCVTLIRNGRYRWEDEADSQTSPENNSQYLHPNLSQSVRPDLTPGAVASPSRPSPHCSYSKLITKIREKQKASVILEDSETLSPAAPSSPVVPVANTVTTDLKNNSAARNGTSSERVVSLVDYPSFNQTADADGSDIEDIAPAFAKKSPKGTSHDYSKIKWPPREIQMVIDKMASYIIKNGSAFEEIVKSRDDSRFEFLNKTHEYHAYYKCKIELYSEVYGDIFKNSNKNQQDVKKKNQNTTSRKNVDQTSKNGGSRTISFSIKSREQEVSLTSHTTFPIESSTSEEDEEMSDGEKERRKLEREQRRQARKLREEKERKEREEFLKKEKLRKEKEEDERKKERERHAAEDDSSGNEDLYDIFKYAQEMEKDTKIKPKPESQEEPVLKQEERKKKAAAFLSKLKDTKEEKKPVYGPQMPPEIEAALLRSASQSPASSSRGSSEREKPPLPLPELQKPPPPPKSPSPPGLTDLLLKNFEIDKPSSSREISTSPKRGKSSGKDSNSLTSGLSSGINDYVKPKKDKKIVEEEEQSSKGRSRSRKKHTRQKSEESWSPSSKRDRKKRKRSRVSTHRRKKHRSRSRSRSRSKGRSKSHRSYHKKKQSKRSGSSHKDKDKSRKKKHKRHRSPSSVSTLPSSESTSPSTPTTLPSESESDMDVQVIESDEKKSSRSSSIVSLPSVCNFSKNGDSKKKSLNVVAEQEEKDSPKVEGYTSAGEENSVSSTLSSQTLLQKSRPLFPALESSNSSEGTTEVERRSHFNPNTSSAMAKIAQGLRAKLNALLEKENKMD